MLDLGLGLGLGRRRRGAGAGHPLGALFGPGDSGRLYAVQPIAYGLQALFQDAAMTVPVTADGDPVGAVRDYSGAGAHATQGAGANRPIYRTDGSHHWLQGDGTQWLTFPGLTATALTTLGAARNTTAGSVLGLYAEDGVLDNIVGVHDGTVFQARNMGDHNTVTITLGSDLVFDDQDAADGTTTLWTSQGSRADVWPPAARTHSVLLARSAGGSGAWIGRWYGGLLIDRTLSSAETDSARQHYAEACGVALP